MTARAGETSHDRSPGRQVVVLALAALFATLAYALIYPWRGFAVPIGLDAPVYLWSGQYAATFGLDADGLLGRPGAFGLVASLLEMLPVGDLTVMAAVQVAVIVTAGLAAAAFTATTFGTRTWLISGLVVLVALFLTPLADGYVSAGLFVACFAAGLGVLARASEEDWLAVTIAVVLFTAGVLSHPLFATIGFPILGSVIAAILVRRRSIGSWRRVVLRIGGTVAIALGTSALLLFVLAPGATPLDTSGDAALRRLGAGSATVIFRRHQLDAELPGFLFLFLAGMLVLDRSIQRSDSSSATRVTVFWATCAGWVAVTAASVLGLAAGLPVPAHRLLWVCLPPVLVIGLAMTALFRSNRSPFGGRWGRVARVAAPIVVLGVFAAVHALHWRDAQPTITAPEASFLDRLGSSLERLPAGTQVVLLAGDGVPITEMIDEVNWLRASVAPERLHDVMVFPGDPPSLYGSGPEPLGAKFHDRVVADYADRVGSTLGADSVITASAPIDPEATAEARKVDGARPFGEDAVLLPPRPGSTAVPVPESGGESLLASWIVPIWATLVIAGFALAGFGWVRWSMPRRTLVERAALSAAVGLAILMIASVLVDAADLRLAEGGSLVAVFLAVVPGVLLWVRAWTRERREAEEAR